jgi:hypothetical protein
VGYGRQSHSLKYVQKFGPELEKAVSSALGWPGGRTVYYRGDEASSKYDLQVDACWPDREEPRAFASVTYTRPDKPGHSNENKLQLKLGELMLLKGNYPEIRSVLIVGGNRAAWLAYVLKAFEFFFDRTIFAWELGFDERVEELRGNPSGVERRQDETWKELAEEWQRVELWTGQPINSSLRLGVWEDISETGREGELPEDVSNEIFRYCMQAAFDIHKRTRGRKGKEWTNYVNEDWDNLWQSRSFFNPAEAAIAMSLSRAGFAFRGGLAQDEAVPSLLHHLGGEEFAQTSVSEDFVLYSRKHDRPVFIQSKATGGGRDGHGKNIQNRTKEQLARSLFYRGSVDDDGRIVLRPKDYHWIGILDGNWGVTKKTPLKYLHMLQWAGYDLLLPADSLVKDDLTLRDAEDNRLIMELRDLDCVTDQDEFEHKWSDWSKDRFKVLEPE